jgi:hypothetical protein
MKAFLPKRIRLSIELPPMLELMKPSLLNLPIRCVRNAGAFGSSQPQACSVVDVTEVDELVDVDVDVELVEDDEVLLLVLVDVVDEVDELDEVLLDVEDDVDELVEVLLDVDDEVLLDVDDDVEVLLDVLVVEDVVLEGVVVEVVLEELLEVEDEVDVLEEVDELVLEEVDDEVLVLDEVDDEVLLDVDDDVEVDDEVLLDVVDDVLLEVVVEVGTGTLICSVSSHRHLATVPGTASFAVRQSVFVLLSQDVQPVTSMRPSPLESTQVSVIVLRK